MDTTTQTAGQILITLRDSFEALFASLSSEWTLYQLAAIIACYALAVLLARVLTPPLEQRLRGLQGQPGLMRALVVPLRRLRIILLALLLFLLATAMREVTWPSRSFLIMLAAQLSAAWAFISIAARVMRNRSLARITAVAAWVLVALQMTGLLDNATQLLDTAALTLGDTRVSLLLVLKGVVTIGVLMWLAAILGDFFEHRLEKAQDLTPTFRVLLAKFAKAVLAIAAVVISLNALGIDLTALAVFSGAVGIGIGFGLQKVASNLISGIIILLDKSLKPGDVISLGDSFGWITSLRSRYVSVVTRDGVEHLIPNETFVSETVVNWSHSNRAVRREISFGISYDNDPHLVRKICVEAVAKLERVLLDPKPVCHVTGFGDSSVDFVLRFWISDPENGVANISGLVYLAVWDTFKANDIQIPYPHREVIVKQMPAAPLDLMDGKAD